MEDSRLIHSPEQRADPQTSTVELEPEQSRLNAVRPRRPWDCIRGELLLLAILEIEPRASYMLDKCFTTSATISVLLLLV